MKLTTSDFCANREILEVLFAEKADLEYQYIYLPTNRASVAKKITKSLSAAGISSAVYSWKRVHLHQKRSLYDCTYIGLQCCWIINGAITTFVIKWNCDRLRIFAIHSLGAFKAWGTSQKDQRPSSQRGLSTSIKYYILPLMNFSDHITLLKRIHGKAVKGGSRLWVSTPRLCKRSLPWWWSLVIGDGVGQETKPWWLFASLSSKYLQVVCSSYSIDQH